ncbi:hypothetical protein DT075_35730 [Bacillus licheniformis]|nr:hypothetical protein DT075_35730 [Bacillus licheniformis]
MKASNAEHTEKMKGLSGISKLFQYGLKEARIFALVSPFMHLVIMSNDTGIVESLISDHFPQFVSGIITIVGSVVILLIMDWKMTLLMLISVPITTFIMIPLGMKMQRISKNNLALAGILALVFIVQAVCDGFSTYFLSYAGQKVVASLRERMWFKLLRLPVRYFDEKTSGETVSRVEYR